MANTFAVETKFRLTYFSLMARLIASSARSLLTLVRSTHKASSKSNKGRNRIVNMHFNIANSGFNMSTMWKSASSNPQNFTIMLQTKF